METHACALSDVYTFGPTFRAEVVFSMYVWFVCMYVMYVCICYVCMYVCVKHIMYVLYVYQFFVFMG